MHFAQTALQASRTLASSAGQKKITEISRLAIDPLAPTNSNTLRVRNLVAVNR